jgi:hypothetical protein
VSGQSYYNLSSHYKEVRTYLLKTTKITFIILKSQFFFKYYVLSVYSDVIFLLLLSKPHDSQLHAEFVTEFFSQCIIDPPVTITQN